MRYSAALAHASGTVCVYLEPVGLNHERDLHEPGDGGMLRRVTSKDSIVHSAQPPPTSFSARRSSRAAREFVGS